MFTESRGFASPFVRVFTPDDRELTFFVSFFKFGQEEKKGTYAEVIFESIDPNIVDQAEFQEGSKLEIIHGYIKGPISERKTYYVMEVKPRYTASGIQLTVYFGDRASYMARNSTLGRSKDLTSKPATRYDYISYLQRQYGVELKVMGITLDQLDKVTDAQGKIRPEYRRLLVDQEIKKMQANSAGPRSLITQVNTIISKDPKILVDKKIKELEKVIPYLAEKPTHPINTSKDNKALRDLMEDAPINIQIHTGGDEVDIEPRNFNQAPLRVYKYQSESSYIEFTPETKDKSKGAGATEINIRIPNRDNHDYSDYNASEETDDSTRLGDIVNKANASKKIRYNRNGDLVNTGITKGSTAFVAPGQSTRNKFGESAGGLNPFIGPTEKTYLVDKAIDPATGQEKIEEKVLLEGLSVESESASYFKRNGIQTTAVDALAQKVAPPIAILDAKEFVESLVEAEQSNSAENTANNMRNEYSVKMNPGNCRVIYDPLMEYRKIIRIENSSKKFSGNYYITKCEHIYQKNQAAITEYTLVRSGRGYTGNEPENKTSAADLNRVINDITEREQDNRRNVTIQRPEE